MKWEWAVEVHHFAYNSAPADKWDRIIVAATVRTMNNHDFLVGVHSHIGHTALLPADVHQNHAIYVDENTMTICLAMSLTSCSTGVMVFSST